MTDTLALAERIAAPLPERKETGRDERGFWTRYTFRIEVSQVERNLIVAALKDYQARQWQDIASAPTKGDVLVYCEDTKEQFVAYWSKNIFTDDVAWTYARFRDDSGSVLSVFCRPTHWIPPPPAPPAPEGQETER